MFSLQSQTGKKTKYIFRIKPRLRLTSVGYSTLWSTPISLVLWELWTGLAIVTVEAVLTTVGVGLTVPATRTQRLLGTRFDWLTTHVDLYHASLIGGGHLVTYVLSHRYTNMAS